MKIIDIKNLSFRYKNKNNLVLNNLSFSCEEGSVNILIGLNASGKTTLIKLIAGLLDFYTGEITIDGKELRTISIKNRSKKMAYVSQHSNNINDFTVLEYLLLSTVNKKNFYESPKEEDYVNVKKVALDFKIEYLLNKKLSEISGGERQIVSICAAVIQDTKIVILDEPTSALDIKNQHIVLSLIKKIAKDQGKTFIISSHNPNHALFLNSNVLLLKDSKIIAQGKASEIINIEELTAIYGDEICYSEELDYKEISFKE